MHATLRVECQNISMHLIISQMKIIGTCIARHMELKSDSYQKLYSVVLRQVWLNLTQWKRKKGKIDEFKNLHELSLLDPSGA